MAINTKAAKAPKQPVKKKSSFRRFWKHYGWPVLRHLIVPVVCILVLFAGMAAGYVIIGDKPMSDVWEWDTWMHMFDLIFAP